MTNQRASCCCGQLIVECTGEPIRVLMCHCLVFQKRISSVFGVQALFRQDQLVIAGRTAQYVRIGDKGGHASFSFCPDCGSTVCWDHLGSEGFVAIVLGAFADPGFTPPTFSVYAVRRYPWVNLPSSVAVWDQQPIISTKFPHNLLVHNSFTL